MVASTALLHDGLVARVSFRSAQSRTRRSVRRAEIPTKPRKCVRRRKSCGFVYCSEADDSSSEETFRAQEGAQMASELKEVAALDKLVDLLLGANSREELVKLVGENILALNQDFWLRMASRSDAGNAQTKEKITSLSKAIMTIVDALVKMTESDLVDSSELMTEILRAAADEKGHWDLPLAPERVEALKQALRKHKARLDDGFLSTAFAWMRKSAEDNITGMVPLVQRMLQLYAAQALRDESSDPTVVFFNELMESDAESWSSKIRAAQEQGILTEEEFLSFIEKKLESTIELASGSYAQRVQVEFLTKLKSEGLAVFAPAQETSAEPGQAAES